MLPQRGLANATRRHPIQTTSTPNGVPIFWPGAAFDGTESYDRDVSSAFAKRRSTTGSAVHPFLAWAFAAAPDVDARELESTAERIFDGLAANESLEQTLERLTSEQRLQRSVRGALLLARVGQLVAEWRKVVEQRSELRHSGSSGLHKRVP